MMLGGLQVQKLEDTFDILRRDWFGYPVGLHIDSYKKIKNVDGYQINLKNIEGKKILETKLAYNKSHKKNLWFVNIGGYDPNSMQEKHEFGLVVASNPLEAKNIAKSKWLKNFKKIHKDDIASLKMFYSVDDCELIKKIDSWEIELIPENSFVQETQAPDWYGYKRIDMI